MPTVKCVLLLLLVAPLACAEIVSVDCGRLRLGFEGATGRWRGLGLAGRAGDLLGAEGGLDVEAVVPGRAWPATDEWEAEPPRVEEGPDGRRVSVFRRSPEWAVTAVYRVSARTPIIQRRAMLRWDGAEPVKIVGTVLRVPGVTLGGAGDGVWCLPGNYPIEEQRIANAVPGRTIPERGWTWSDTGFAYARSDEAGAALLVAYGLDLDAARIQVEQLDGGVSLAHCFRTLAVLEPGEEIEIGTQWLQLVEGGEAALRRAASALAERVNPGPPADRPEWLEGAVLEELHPWGRLESWGTGDRGGRMPSIEAQLPYLRDLGVTGVWLLPVSEHPPWVYHLPRFRQIDPQVTSPEQLRSFIAAGHQLGMRTLMDLVTYGVAPDSPDVASLPDHVWCVDEQGERQKAWSDSVLAADCSDADWRRHTVELGSFWVKEFGADGFRLDCGGSGQTPNWRPRSGHRANAAMLAGGVGQNALLREAIREINPDAILMPEAGATCNFGSGDLLFDYPFYMVCREITREPRIERWIAETRRWLAGQQLTHSPRQQASMVRFLENHDTVAAQDFFGIGPSQALTALCAFVPGVLLLHQEQEIGFAPELREWLRLRHELPELRSGGADFESVTAADPRVMAFLRLTDDAASVVATNFGPSASACTLDWPDEVAERLPACQDAVTGEPVERGQAITIPAYRPVVLTLRAEPRSAPQPEATAPASGSLVLARDTSEPDEDTTRHTIRFAPVTRWFVRTNEGLLRDEFVDRHRGTKEGETHVDATPPLWRCWRPLEQGYWDGPGPASLGVIAADGRAAEVQITDSSQLRRVRIGDPSSVGKQAAVWLEGPRGVDPFAGGAARLVEHPDADALLRELRQEPFGSRQAHVEIDPLWVRVSNDHYAAAFARRHGGTLFGLWHAGDDAGWIADSSEVYTDWGLYKKGLHVATEWETNPRLEVLPRGDATEITFRGKLRRPAWNGVHAGYVIQPEVAVRLTYLVDASPVIRVTVGATPATDRPDTKAFLAYRLPLAGVESWEARGVDAPVNGRPGDDRGKRVYEAHTAGDKMSRVAMELSARGRRIRLRAFAGEPDDPQNPFLLDGGDTMHFFFAMLNGTAVTLPAGTERTASFEIAVE